MKEISLSEYIKLVEDQSDGKVKIVINWSKRLEIFFFQQRWNFCIGFLIVFIFLIYWMASSVKKTDLEVEKLERQEDICKNAMDVVTYSRLPANDSAMLDAKVAMKNCYK